MGAALYGNRHTTQNTDQGTFAAFSASPPGAVRSQLHSRVLERMRSREDRFLMGNVSVTYGHQLKRTFVREDNLVNHDIPCINIEPCKLLNETLCFVEGKELWNTDANKCCQIRVLELPVDLLYDRLSRKQDRIVWGMPPRLRSPRALLLITHRHLEGCQFLGGLSNDVFLPCATQEAPQL